MQHRGGRSQGKRSYSGRPYNGGRWGADQEQFVTGDSHFHSVHDANLGFRQGGMVAYRGSAPRYNQNQQPRQYPPPQQQQFGRYQNQPFQRGRPFNQYQNQVARPRLPKPLDYRNWEYAKTAPPRDAEKFIVLSYNILADYLANDHRSKLYYHVPRHMMDWQWRKRNIIFELGLWSPDIMCFQEVDRFRELEEELKLRGYHGIWKMRTGTAIDGCAVFWRRSRFKLLYEEAIEFNKLGLRDNVAQICVLELMGQNNATITNAVPSSSEGSNKVVICNIHVLYNPKRGDIKLGQVRILLGKARAVSAIWNDAPVVLCGDFNCTPKSPLYNFICEQKLDLSGLHRDKLSGQASAEIHSPRPNTRDYSTLRTEPPDNSSQVSSVANHKPVDFHSEIGKQNNLDDESVKNISSINDETRPKYTRTVTEASDMSCMVEQHEKVGTALHVEKTIETLENVEYSHPDRIKPALSVLVDSSDKSAVEFNDANSFHGDQSNDETCKLSQLASHSEDAFSEEKRIEHREKTHSCPSSQLSCELSQSNVNIERTKENFRNLQISPPGSSECDLQSTLNDENAANKLDASTGIYVAPNKQLDDDASSQQQNDSFLKDGITDEEHSTVLAALHDEKETSKQGVDNSPTGLPSDPDDSDLHSPSNGVLDDSVDLDAVAVGAVKTAYDPSLWTPMEIATATGNADCITLEHPLKLKSAYAEVEDGSGTRDSNGEPLVTSYNRCFLGTVDYIWLSEGLQTVRVLAPISKQFMQSTRGFPTKKWGSDHIALASEFAFTKDARIVA